jgi:hypothetical protein
MYFPKKLPFRLLKAYCFEGFKGHHDGKSFVPS